MSCKLRFADFCPLSTNKLKFVGQSETLNYGELKNERIEISIRSPLLCVFVSKQRIY